VLFNILKCVVLMSLSGGLITLVLYLFSPLTKRVFSARWHYCVGVVALLLFFVPLSYVQFPVSFTAKQAPQSHAVSDYNAATGSFSTAMETVRTLPVSFQSSRNEGAVPKENMDVGEITAIVYLVVAGGFACIKLSKYRSFLKKLGRSSHLVKSDRARAIFKRSLLEMKVKRRVALISCEGAGTPFLTGIVHPKVFIPQASLSLSDQELELIFSHELTHCRRGDMAVKVFCSVACVFHWFNPLCYMLTAWLNRSSEMACDEFVVNRFEHEQRKCYGNAILNSVSFSKIPSGEFSAALYDGKSMLKERLVHIMNYQKSGRGLAAVSLCAALVISLAGCAASQTVLKADVAKDNSKTVSVAVLAKKDDVAGSPVSNPIASGQVETYSKRIEDFLDQNYNAGGTVKFAISDVSIADKGAVTSTDDMSVEDISFGIVENVRNYSNDKISSIMNSSNGKINIDSYAFSSNTNSSKWNIDSTSRIKALADVFANRSSKDSVEIPMYVIYLDKNGQPCKIPANDDNMEKAQSGIDPIPD
jgi:beta-lactamase regulating signal transducer with metallopeptidase domain